MVDQEDIRLAPVFGDLAQGGVTRYVTFEDVKKMVTSFVKEMAAEKVFSRSN